MSESLAPIITSVVTGGTNNHATVSSEANAYATDFITQGVLGSISNSNGTGPGIGSFGVSQDSSPDMGLTITGSGNTTNGESVAYIKCTPASQDIQVLRARMSTNTTGYTINANSTGSTVYDWIYLQANVTNAAAPDAAADNVVAIYTSRSTTNAADNGSPPTYGILLAVVTVSNGASSITNTNIADKRTQITFNTGTTASTTGWSALGYTLTYGANNGNREFTMTTANNLIGELSPGMKTYVNRSITPPSNCASFTAASSMYAKNTAPSGISFTATYTCEAWIYLYSYQANAMVISQQSTTTGSGWYFRITSGQVTIAYGSTSTGTNIATYQSIPLNQWVHVAGVVSSVSGKTVALYINGTLAPSYAVASTATTLTQSGYLEVGSYGDSSGQGGQYFDGLLSEVRVWSTARTQSQIQSYMAINALGSESGLVALYQFNGAWTDGTTNANTLTAVNGASNTYAGNPFNAIEYAVIESISYSSPTTTLTVSGGNACTIPNQTLNNPYYSFYEVPYGLPGGLGNNRVIASNLVAASQNNATTSDTLIIGTAITVTIPTGGRMVEIEGFNPAFSDSSSSTGIYFSIYNAASVTGTPISTSQIYAPAANTGNEQLVRYRGFFPAGSQSFCLAAHGSSATLTTNASALEPTTIQVKLIS